MLRVDEMRTLSPKFRWAVITGVTFAVTAAGCAGLMQSGSEGAMKVRGEIVSDGGEPCLVELRRSDDSVVERFTAKGVFERTITVDPGTKAYHFVVSCSGRAPFTSRTYQIGGTTYFTTPLDLGPLYFPRGK